MRTLLLLLISTVCAFAQTHHNKPLPRFTSKPTGVIEELTGWSYSKDGQWIFAENKIPVRALSTDPDQYKTEENKLGMDNIEELQLYPVLYGKDTLIALVKIYESGSYQLPAIRKGWKTHKEGYFYLFSKKDLGKLKQIDKEAAVVKIDLLDYGKLGPVNSRKVPRELKTNLLVKPKTDRQLVFTAKRRADNKIYFQLASMHKVFSDVEGVLKDFTMKGKTVYGSPALLDYLHYEYDMDDFHEFLSLPATMTFER